MDKRAEASIIQQQYEQGLQYQKAMGFTNKWPEYERFKAGQQWPAPTELTKNLPRPVFNIIDYIENHKIASVMNENIKMIYTAEEIGEGDPVLDMAAEGADKFTQMADATWEDIQQDMLNEDVLESASNLGTGITHYYMDMSVSGGITQKWQGKLVGEDIDPINIFFGNPQCKDVQKQPWIIISSRDTVENVKEMAKGNKVPTEDIVMITGDSDTKAEGYDAAQKEIKEGDKCTVLTKYQKKNNTVWFVKICNGVIVKPWTNTNRKLYPIALMQWKKRKKCIFGIGDTEGLIPNQKGVNFLLAMMLLSAQQTAWPKLLVKSGALKQVITNTPGEIITDMSPTGSDGIKYLQPGRFNEANFALVDKFVDLTKQLSAAQDAATGDMDTGNLNATAIMLLQKASGIPIESIKKRFYRYIEDVGRIWEEFFKVNYNLDRMVKFNDEDGKEYSGVFNGSEYQDIGMSLKIDVGPSSGFSESLMMSSLDRFLDKQLITFEDYLEFAPKNVVPFKDRLKKRIEERMEQQPDDGMLDELVNQMTPEEMDLVQNDPQAQQVVMEAIGGGAGGSMPGM